MQIVYYEMNSSLNINLEDSVSAIGFFDGIHRGHQQLINKTIEVAEEKGLMEEFALYDLVERLAGQQIMEHRKLFKNVCANVDFYSGFVYSMLGIPQELFTPLFAIARMSGWSAHRLEELVNAGKIIRPAYKYVGKHIEFTELEER